MGRRLRPPGWQHLGDGLVNSRGERFNIMFQRSCVRTGCWSALLFCLAGCQGGTALPPTFPVTGKVVWKGGEPLINGGILLSSVADPNIVASGNIEKGEFSVFTLID